MGLDHLEAELHDLSLSRRFEGRKGSLMDGRIATRSMPFAFATSHAPFSCSICTRASPPSN